RRDGLRGGRAGAGGCRGGAAGGGGLRPLRGRDGCAGGGPHAAGGRALRGPGAGPEPHAGAGGDDRGGRHDFHRAEEGHFARGDCRRASRDLDERPTMKEKIVLAYSGGLDTSILVHLLTHRHGYEVVACHTDVGEAKDPEALAERAKAAGAVAFEFVE